MDLTAPTTLTSPQDSGVIRILIADDYPVVREGLVSMIGGRPDMRIVAEASDGQAAVDLFATHRPDVVVLDVRMPRLDGIEATARIRSLDRGARIILFTGFEGGELVYQGLQAGAKAYLLKDITSEQLLQTILKVYDGGTQIGPAIAAKLAARVTRPKLTVREMDVLRLMATGKGNKEIASLLFVTEGTVKAHVSNLLRKLKAASRTEAINLAITRGIVSLE